MKVYGRIEDVRKSVNGHDFLHPAYSERHSELFFESYEADRALEAVSIFAKHGLRTEFVTSKQDYDEVF